MAEPRLTRRTLLTGLGALVCAPAIVRASSLMPVRAWRTPLTLAEWANRVDAARARQVIGYLFEQGILGEMRWAPVEVDDFYLVHRT